MRIRHARFTVDGLKLSPERARAVAARSLVGFGHALRGTAAAPTADSLEVRFDRLPASDAAIVERIVAALLAGQWHSRAER